MYAPPPQAVNQELMHYWLQQLQVKRWQHRQTSTSPDGTGNTDTDGERRGPLSCMENCF